MNKEELNKNIEKAREHIKDLYKKYGQELYDITLKIDNYLKQLQEGLKGGNDDGYIRDS